MPQGTTLGASDVVHLNDLKEELVEARKRIDLVIGWIGNKSIIGEISKPGAKKERKPRKAKGPELGTKHTKTPKNLPEFPPPA